MICHGDFVSTNLCVVEGHVTGVSGWSNVAFAEPAYEVAVTLARLKSYVPRIPPLLAWITRTVQGRLERSDLASHRREGLAEADRLLYYEAHRLLDELVWSAERLRALPDDVIENRWLHAATIERRIGGLHASTGVRLTALHPGDDA